MDHCSNCGKEIEEDKLYEVSNFDADEIQHVCGDCLEFYTKCDQCGLLRPNDSFLYSPIADVHICNLCSEDIIDEAEPELDQDEESWRD